MNNMISRKVSKSALLLLSFLAFFLISSCDKDLYNDFDDVSVSADVDVPKANVTVQQVKDMYQAGGYVIPKDGKRYILTGRVVSNDYDGNFYTEMYIEDETGGIKVSLNIASVYASYPTGSLVAIKLNGLKLGAYGDQVSIGIDTDKTSSSGSRYENDRIPYPLVEKYIIGPGDVKAPKAKEVNLSDIGSVPGGTYIRINDVQFIESELNQTWADATDPQNKQTINRHIEQRGNSIRLIVRTSGYARFANDRLPQGSGYITGILTRFRGTPQLIINSPTEFKMTNERFGKTNPVDLPEANTKIGDLRRMLNFAKFSDSKTITDDLVVKGTVISSDEYGEFYKQIYIQGSDNMGLKISVDAKKTYLDYPVGSVILIKLKGLTIGAKFGGLLLGNNPDEKFVVSRMDEGVMRDHLLLADKSSPISPKVLTIGELQKESIFTLVRIKDLKAKTPGEPWNDTDKVKNNIFTDAEGRTIEIRTSNFASFRKEKQPDGSLTITGILDFFKDQAQIMISSDKDVVKQ